MGDGPQICRLIGEPYSRVFYTECLRCGLRNCPIQKILSILRQIAPEEMWEVDGEASS